MKKLLYILVLISSLQVFGQNEQIESLKSKIELNSEENNFGELFICYSAIIDEYINLRDTTNIVYFTLRMADASRRGGGHLEALNIVSNLEESGYYVKPDNEIASCLLKGSVYYELGKNESSVFWAKRGVEISNTNNNDLHIPLLNNLLGASYSKINSDSAFHYIQLSIDGYLSRKDTSGVALPYINMARLYTDKNEIKEAEKMIFNAIAFLDKEDVPIYRRMAYDFLAELYNNEKEYEQVVKYLRLRDSVYYAINSNEIKFQITQFQNKLEKQKNQSDVLTLRAKIELAQMKNRADNVIIILGLISLVALSMFLFFSIRNNGRFKDLNEQLKLKTKRLEKLDEFKNKVLSVISHDMRAPLAQVITLYQAKNSGINFSDSEIREMDRAILASTKSGLLTLDNLLKWANSQIDGAALKIESLDSVFILTQILNQVSQLAGEKEITITTYLEPNKIRSDESLFQIIMRNILSNAIKFSPKNSEIIIKSHSDNGFLIIDVIDQGPGISDQILAALDANAEIKPKVGSFGEKGAGIGLHFSLEFAKKIDGKITFVDTSIHGTHVSFTTPIS